MGWSMAYGCKTSQNHPFIKSERQKFVQLVTVTKPYVDFVLENGDTLKFSNYDVSFLLEKRIKNKIKTQGRSDDEAWSNNWQALVERRNDTIVYQNLSAVDEKTLGGILDIWIARELLIEGKAIVAQANQFDRPKRLKYVVVKDNLGGQHGTFYNENGKMIYRTIIALGE